MVVVGRGPVGSGLFAGAAVAAGAAGAAVDAVDAGLVVGIWRDGPVVGQSRLRREDLGGRGLGVSHSIPPEVSSGGAPAGGCSELVIVLVLGWIDMLSEKLTLPNRVMRPWSKFKPVVLYRIPAREGKKKKKEEKQLRE